MPLATRLAECTNSHMPVSDRVKVLRKRLGLSQAQVADRGDFRRDYVTKVETGKNLLTTLDLREGMAKGLGLALADFNAYLRGDIDLDGAVGRARAPDEPRVRLERDPEPAVTIDDPQSPLEAALGDAFDSKRHTLRDVNAVQQVIRRTERMSKEHADWTAAARQWLDAAAQLRKEGDEVTLEALLFRITVGKGAVARKAAEEHASATQAAADQAAREMGYEPGELAGKLGDVLSAERKRRGGEGSDE